MSILSGGVRRLTTVSAGAAILLAALGSAQAQSKLDARYVATIAGIPVGKGAWVIDLAGDQYTAAASGRTAGLVQAFSSGEGSTASRGLVTAAGHLAPMRYAATVTTDKKTEAVRMTIATGAIKEVAIEPVPPPPTDRVPITDAHRKGVTDPMSASLLAVAGAGDPLVAEACNRTLPIFDGRQRFDLALSYKRHDTVKAVRGYQGPVLVCAVRFVPIAGHRPNRAAIKYLSEARDIEVWLAPLAGTRVIVPFRISVPTPIGPAVLEATQFVTASHPMRPAAAAAPAKTQ